MAQANRLLKLSSPHVFLLRMVVFLILAGFVALILYRQIAVAFMANPGLNSLIIGVLFVGILLTLRQVGRLFRLLGDGEELQRIGKAFSAGPRRPHRVRIRIPELQRADLERTDGAGRDATRHRRQGRA